MRRNLARALGILVLSFGIAACRQDMHDTPRYEPLEASSFFGDGRSSRVPVVNTVARGQHNDGPPEGSHRNDNLTLQLRKLPPGEGP